MIDEYPTPYRTSARVDETMRTEPWFVRFARWLCGEVPEIDVPVSA